MRGNASRPRAGEIPERFLWSGIQMGLRERLDESQPHNLHVAAHFRLVRADQAVRASDPVAIGKQAA